MKIKKKLQKSKKRILWILFIAYLVFNTYLLLQHEMWRDEINVWLMGRELSVIQLFQELKYQGHPCLWYLLVMPFAKFGLPCQIMGVISLGIMSLATWIFVFFGPFSVVTKFMLIFSPAFTYYYPVIARAYCLVALGIILAAYYYQKRYERPVIYGILLGLLVQAETIAVPVAGFISMNWALESIYLDLKYHKFQNCRQTLKGIWIPLVSFLLYMITMAKVSDSPVFEVRDIGLYDATQAIKQMLYYISTRLTGNTHSSSMVTLIVLFVLAAFWILVTKQLLPWGVFGGTVAFQVIFSVIIYELNIWHFLSLVFVLLWTFWVSDKNNWKVNKWQQGIYYLTQIFLIVFGLQMFIHWTGPVGTNLPNALYGSYSDAYNASRFIKNEIAPDEIIVEVNVPYVSTIWGFLPEYHAYFAGNGELVSYADWSEKQSRFISFSDLQTWVKNTFPKEKSYILIVAADSYLTEWEDGLENTKTELLYQTTIPSERQEDYSIYRIALSE